ncbi:MAG TPA: hypothetical protein VF572_02250 [Candidatus Saccharimonadales bacterium]|jgi:hypothetical protein
MKQKLSIFGRAFAVLGILLASVGGVTYAALNSNRVTLSDTSISTATAGLQIWNAENNAFEEEAPGFKIEKLVPGEGVDEMFYLRNSGDVPLFITAHVPTLPQAPQGSTASNNGFGFVGYENVTLDISSDECDEVVNTNLLALNAGEVELPCNSLAAGAQGNTAAEVEGNYNIHFDIKESAVNGGQAGVGNFDIVFSGTSEDPSADEGEDNTGGENGTGTGGVVAPTTRRQ